MKTKILFFFLIIFFMVNKVSAQSISQEQKDSIITNLYSNEWRVNFYAIHGIELYQIYEAIPILENEIWKKEPESRLLFVKAMNSLHSDNFREYARDLFDSLQSNIYKDFDSVNVKLELLSLLFQIQDFSKIEYLIIKTSEPAGLENFRITDLWGSAIEFQELSEISQNYLLFIFSNSNSTEIRSRALFWLGKNNKAAITPYLLSRFNQEGNFSIKWTILKEFLPYGTIETVSNVLRESITIETDQTLLREIVFYLLDSLKTPSNYYYVKNWLNDQSNFSRLKKIALIHDRISIGKPISPDSNTTIQEIIDSTNSYLSQSAIYTWLGDLTFSNELKNILTTAKTNLQAGDSLACRVQVKAFQDFVDNVYKDSLNTDARFVTIEGWKFLYWNAQYILDRLPEPPANPNLVVSLKNSLGNQIPASNVKYYEGSWKDALNNGDGTFTVITTRATLSIRVFYEYASQQVDNVPAQNNTYTFTTVNAAVQLKNSLGNFIDAGTVQYYAGAWRSFGTTSNGVAYKELLPINYSFRMTYEYGSIDKQQNLSSDPTVVFQTVNAAVQLKNSLGNLIDSGTVQYYAGAWRTFGTTSNGVAYKELLPTNYSFRMTYEYVSNDKQQNLSTNPVVDFNTVLCSVKVSKTSNNQPINNAAVKYYSGAWRNLGTTNTDGIATKELLPKNLSFRATFGNVSQDKQQDISVNNLVEILLNVP